MPNHEDRPANVKKDSPLDIPYHFVMVIEGGLEAPDRETVEGFCMASVSTSAAFSQLVQHMKVVVMPQEEFLRQQALRQGVRQQ